VLIWKAWATKSNVSLYQLAPSTRPTEGTGCGLLHTPAADDAREATQCRPGRTPDTDYLRRQIAFLATPKSTLSGPDYARANRKGSGGESQRGTFAPGDAIQNTLSLTGAETGAKLRLSPAFVEWMMGYPEGWLDFPMEPQSPKADGDRTHSKPMETP
jgi:hypothetical protein